MIDFKEYSDEELICRLRAGESSIEEYLLEKYKPFVKSKSRALFLVGGDREDLIQEGMIGLYKSVMANNSIKNDNFANFATMCIHHQVQNAVKIANSKKNMPLNDYVSINIEGKFTKDDDTPKIILQATDKGAEELSLDKESETALYKRVKAALNDEQYSILIMYLNGYSYVEMAKKHGVTSKKIDNDIQSIKRKLKIILKGER